MNIGGRQCRRASVRLGERVREAGGNVPCNLRVFKSPATGQYSILPLAVQKDMAQLKTEALAARSEQGGTVEGVQSLYDRFELRHAPLAPASVTSHMADIKGNIAIRCRCVEIWTAFIGTQASAGTIGIFSNCRENLGITHRLGEELEA